MTAGKPIFKRIRTYAMRHFPYMLTCRELEDFITDYLEGTLSRRQRRTFELHLALCRDCRRYLERYKRTVSLSREAYRDPDAAVPEDVPAELVEAILSLRQRSNAHSSRGADPGPAAEPATDSPAKPVASMPGRQEKGD